MKIAFFISFLHILLHARESLCTIDGIYCGSDDCYDVINVPRNATKSEIAKAYRQLARKYHPDMFKTPDDKKEAAIKFRKIANAYEILKDDELRSDYDFMLDHPDMVYSHYYRYYRRRMTPRVDVKIVVVALVIVVSICQYFIARQRYDEALNHLVNTPRYRFQAIEIAKSSGILSYMNDKKSRKNKAECREEMDSIVKKILEDQMDLKGGYTKPRVKDVILVKIFLVPYYIFGYISWYVKWIWNFNIMKREYGTDEKFYLIRRLMKLSENEFEQFTDEQQKEFLKSELWVPENYKRWKEKREEEVKRQMAENPRFKAYRRYVKNKGNARFIMDD